jgi:hypothetical protein
MEPTMAKKANAAPAVSAPMSNKDLGFQFASNLDKLDVFRKLAGETIPGFPDNVSKEDKAEVVSGFALRYNQNHPAQHYKLEGQDVLIPVAQGGDVRIDVYYATELSSFEFGQMRKDRPNHHAAVKVMRDGFSQYASRCWAALTKKQKDGKRDVNLSFYEYMKKLGDTLEKRNATANKKADPSAVGKTEFRKAWDSLLVAITK